MSQVQLTEPIQQAVVSFSRTQYACHIFRAQRDASAKAASSAASKAGTAPEVIVTYASQTGTAQEIAKNIQAESSQHGVRSKVSLSPTTSFPVKHTRCRYTGAQGSLLLVSSILQCCPAPHICFPAVPKTAALHNLSQH